ncbi:MAG TPA: hypothetical protein VL128_09655 [Candidatus Eisenbacteria bacterium]|nr:hypothetical protein [Candidatus Eisenbacteria bacterium]
MLLAVLILYNPFAALTNSGNRTVVRNIARHRATVGASELQQLAPNQEQNQQADVTLQETRAELTGPVLREYRTETFERDVEVPQPESVSRVWSRPPPSV